MKSAGWIALLLVIAVSMVGWAQCGSCGVQQEPGCYQAFKTTETIEFSLIAPIDYFVLHQATVSPGIFGWRVEASDGTVVRTVIYPGEPKGAWITMEWDLYDYAGYLVPPGSYQIIVMTTDSDVAYPVRIVGACGSCGGCYGGWYVQSTRDNPCCIPFGELYLQLRVGETRSCGGLSISLTVHIESSGP